LKALDDYTAALAAIRKAQDRADLDNAAAQASAAVGALAQSAPIPYGAAAGPVAKASSSAVLWLVGQDLGYRRLHELQNATGIACEPMDVLADVLEVVLEEQRDASIDAVSKKIEVATGPAGAALNQRLDDLMNQRDAIETAATDAVLAPTRGHCGGGHTEIARGADEDNRPATPCGYPCADCDRNGFIHDRNGFVPR
jgi:hypothetical protein